MTVFDYPSYMCMPIAMKGMPMKMLMVNGNVYLSQTMAEAPRGRSALYSTSMIMGDIGTSVGSEHYLNLDVMLTAEKWTVPERGYPLLLQIGERDSNGVPYVDAQHPHSSPLMGVTLSDTINLDSHGDYVKVFFAPRGESTDGPIAFMHRPTGMVSADAPIGHHIGQDVGHISSTVIGASIKVKESRFEFSAFHGQEPQPEKIDLPLGALNSVSMRYIQDLSPHHALMVSGAYLKDPESTGDSKAFQTRYSASLYQGGLLSNEWSLQNALITGVTQKYDHAEVLFSFGEEFLLQRQLNRIFGRVEILERTADELGFSDADLNSGRWVGAMTVGYSRELTRIDAFGLYLGTSLTHAFLPQEWRAGYGGDPWAGKVYLQLGGMKMVHLMSDRDE
jgi:hypothetical protein